MRRALGINWLATVSATIAVAVASSGAMPMVGANASVPFGLRVGANYRLDPSQNPVRGLDAPGLAVDPVDMRHVVAVDQDLLSGQCDYHVSFDAGLTWTGGHLAAPADFPAQPCVGLNGAGYPHVDESVAFGSGDNVYAVFDSRQRGPGLDSVLVARSSDGGRHFAPAAIAVSGAGQTTFNFVRAQLGVLATSSGDTVYVSAWGTAPFPAVDNQVFVARSTDGGQTWSAPTNVNGPASPAIEPTQPVVSSNGSVHLGWRTIDARGAPHQLMEANSIDGGATWQQAPVGPVTGLRRTDPKMAIDPHSSTLYLTYQFGSLQGESQAPNFGNPDIVLRRSTDGGATWSAPRARQRRRGGPRR